MSHARASGSGAVRRGKGRVASAWTLARALAHVFRGLRTIRRDFAHIDWPQRQAHVQRWSHDLLGILGVQLEVQGPEGHSPQGLVVINHVSWLDILVINAALPVRFVSKSDVKHWPVLGGLIVGAGTLLIERASRRDAMRVVHQMAEHLGDGHRVAIFPEGTTHDGSVLLPFHANLIQAAIAAEAPVTPVGLSYWDWSQTRKSDAPVYIGDMTLVASMWRTLRQGPVHARVVWAPPHEAQARTRRQWARDLEQQVARLSHTPPPAA